MTSNRAVTNRLLGAIAMATPTRRDFLKTTSLTTLSLTPLAALIAGPFTAEEVRASETPFIPAEKRLDAQWVASIFEKGSARVYRGEELGTIGMPVGGIAAGQVYLAGDGRLAHFEIFNREAGYYYGYRTRGPDFPIEQGFAISAGEVTKSLDRSGFPEVEFVGEYPIGTNSYADKSFPLKVTQEAFSPFVPLNGPDSAIPATLLHFTIQNTSEKAVDVVLNGHLENAVCHHSRMVHDGTRNNRVNRGHGGVTILECSAVKMDPSQVKPVAAPTVFADFEGGDYGDWKTEGIAFGAGPARGTIPPQQRVSGFAGKGLVNSFHGGDEATGKMISRAFTIERPFITFLVGGGSHQNKTCINLVVDGKMVRTQAGNDEERLRPAYFDVREHKGKSAHLEIIDSAKGAWGHINIDQIEFADRPYRTDVPMEQDSDFGTMALAVMGDGEASTNYLPGQPWKGAEGESSSPLSDKLVGALAYRVNLPAGEKHEVTFAVAWHFPNRAKNGNFYATRFETASAVAAYLTKNLDRLTRETRLWHATYYDSTLPHWLLDRLHMPVSTLATGTSQWWKNGRYWAWEGVGCCEGTCTHVYNYSQAPAHLFPELERSAREMQDFGEGFHENGLVGFRGNDAYAADGQCGTILKAYREHLHSKDSVFLEKNYPRIKQAMQFLIDHDASPQGGRNWKDLGTAPHPDGNPDGVIEDPQHNTYDIWFHGPNPFIAALYIAALRSAERMAKLMKDDSFAATCAKLAESGAKFMDEKLFDGEYYVQLVDLKIFPEHQYDHGCLSDQLFGQNWATMLDIGHVVKGENVRSALRNIYKYNWTPDVGAYSMAHPPGRWFARAGEAGLITCTFPKSPYLTNGVLYREEVWTGIEYQVGSHMIAEGMVQEGLTVVRGLHDRYDAKRHNPWNEIECSDHYSRAMASWGCLTALSGYHYDGPAGLLRFDPKMTPENFRCAFTTAAGWGTYWQTKDVASIVVKYGEVLLKSLAVPGIGVKKEVAVNGKSVGSKSDGAAIVFDSLILRAGDEMTIKVFA